MDHPISKHKYSVLFLFYQLYLLIYKICILQVSLIGEGIQDRVETVEGTVSGVDLESELREFLESDPTLTSFPLHDENDRTIEEILSES